jgi:hypothetical protein
MRKSIQAICVATTLLAAGTTNAAALECPVMPDVLAQPQGAASNISVAHLGAKISETVASGGSLHLIANRLKTELPSAKSAEIVDILIAAYCQDLQTSAPTGGDPAQVLADFEKTAYDAVYNAPTQEAEKGGWLYN